MNKLGTKFRFIGMIFFIIYLLVLCYFLFFAEAFGRGISLEAHGYNTTPFFEIRRYIDNFDKLGMITVMNLGGNVLAFMPFGFFRPIIGRRKNAFFRTLIQGCLFSLMVEVIQLLTNVGSFDVDDIILNTFGVFLGYIIFILFKLIIWRRE